MVADIASCRHRARVHLREPGSSAVRMSSTGGSGS
jgi:hypothetical protein